MGSIDRRTFMASVAASLLLVRLRDARARERGTGVAPEAPAGVPSVGVAISLRWKSEQVAHALARTPTSEHHTIANELVHDFTITRTVNGQHVELRHAGFDRARDMYTARPLRPAEVERLFDRSAAAFAIDLRFSYYAFFDVLLEQMTRTDADLHTLANPNDSAAILGTFDHEMEDDTATIVYHSKSHRLRRVPCTLVDIEVKRGAPDAAPTLELVFELDFTAATRTRRRDDTRKLVAMDWSELVRAGETPGPLPAQSSLWKANVLLFLTNQTDMQRAERLRSEIVKRHATKRPRELADDVRKDVDLHLVTANRWGATREDRQRERHQAILSDLLETLHVNRAPVSPIQLSRELTRRYKLSLDERVAMTLQYGCGYCGEHARASFSVLRSIMDVPGNHVDSIVLCGNANIDHGFVLCNLQVHHVLITRATSSANTRLRVGQDIKVFDLREALAENGEHEVYVVDPYLDRSMSARTGKRLLRALNSKRKQERGKDTDFLEFELQYPEPSDFAVEDIRERPLAERMERVRNV